MAAENSPQPLVVGELIQNNTTTIPNQKENIIIQNSQLSYAASLFQTNTSVFWNQTNLKQVEVIHGVPTFQFTREERLDYAKEEGLHQAIVVKLSSNLLELSTLRNLLPKILGIKGQALIGQLAPRQILIRMDQFDDFGTSLERSVLYFNHNGRQHQIRVFPWSIDFSVMEETTKAAVWISMPNLPPELFAKKALLSIASTVGLPILIDKPTLLKSRPSTARVKVILDLKEKLPEKVVLQLVDEQTGKINDWHQVFVYDNIPLYCYHCNHLGHDENSCRNLNGKKVANAQEEEKSVKQGEEPAVKEVKDQLDNQKIVKESNYVAMGITAGDVSVGPKEDNGVTINNCETNYFVQTAEYKEKGGSLIQNEIGVQISNEKGTALESDIAKHDEKEGHLCHLAKQGKDSNIESSVGQLGLENNQKVAHGKSSNEHYGVRNEEIVHTAEIVDKHSTEKMGKENAHAGHLALEKEKNKASHVQHFMEKDMSHVKIANSNEKKLTCEMERAKGGPFVCKRGPVGQVNEMKKLNKGAAHGHAIINPVVQIQSQNQQHLSNHSSIPSFSSVVDNDVDHVNVEKIIVKAGKELDIATTSTVGISTDDAEVTPDDEGDNWITVRKSSRKKHKNQSTVPLHNAPGHGSGGMQARKGIWQQIVNTPAAICDRSQQQLIEVRPYTTTTFSGEQQLCKLNHAGDTSNKVVITDHERALLGALNSPKPYKSASSSSSKITARKLEVSVANRQEPYSDRRLKRHEPLWMVLQDEINQKLEATLRIPSSDKEKKDELIELCPEEATTIGDLSPSEKTSQKGEATSTSKRSETSENK